MKKVSKSLEPHLERIQELVARMDETEKRFSKIERDMLLSALRDMYDAVYLLESEEAVAESDTTLIEPAVEGPRTVEDPAMSVLLAEVDAEPIYAADPDLVAQEERAEQMPSVEEIEGVQNDDLFEEEKDDIRQSEPEPEQVMEPEPELKAAPMPDPEPEKESAQPSEPVPDRMVETVKEQPKTLWEKLNDKQKVGTIAETMVATRTISDIYEAAKQETADAAKQEPPVKEPPARPTVEEPQKEEPIVQQHTQEQDAKQPSLFDYFKPAAENPTQRIIADSLGLNRMNDIDTKLSSSKVKDLRTVININDKFSFMNELFHNNMKGYNDFIMKLNALDDRVQAQNYVNEIAMQYNWDEESLTVKTFFSIFDRKF